MPRILETVQQKLSELREINVEEIQQNLARLKEEKARLETLTGNNASERKQIKEQKISATRESNKLEISLSGIRSYVPIMELLLQKQRDGMEVEHLAELLHISTYGGLTIEGRDKLSELDQCLSSLREKYSTSGDDLIREISQIMRPNDKVWGMILRRIDSSAELLSYATQLNLSPIIEQNFGRITDYEFEEKTEEAGKYFGGNAIFTYQPHDISKPPQEVKFFVKGHQNFEMESNKRTNSTRDPKVPDMKEVLVYKILEHIGFGPKMHYFINPTARHGLFVATQDSKFTKSPEAKNKIFSTADKVQELAQKPSLTDEVELTALDIITRSLVLKDLHMKNYGRVDVFPTEGSDAQEKHKWKLFDFLVLGSAQLDEYDVHKEIGENFVRIHNHPDPRFTTSSSLAGSILRSENLAAHRPQVANTALEILEGKIRRGSGAEEMSFEQAIISSHGEVTDFIRREGEVLGINVEEALRDIDIYCGAVTRNYGALKERIPLMGREPATVLRLNTDSEEKETVRK